jgi:uncharacterized protein YlxW (UPF0749 family)
MNQFEMVVLIVAIVMIASVMRARYGYSRRGRRGRGDLTGPSEDAETQRLRDEVKQLKERIAVLERITVEKENSLERQIEQLRDR